MATRNKRLGIGVAGMLAAGLLVAAVLPAVAQEPPPPIALEQLTARSDFSDDVSGRLRIRLAGDRPLVMQMPDMSRTVVAKITVQPGAQFPWHTHPGPVVVNVAEGELIYTQAKDCVPRSYPVGKAFVDPGKGNVHTAHNPTDGVTVLIATFFEVPAAGPLTITEGIAIPDDCDVAVGTHNH